MKEDDEKPADSLGAATNGWDVLLVVAGGGAALWVLHYADVLRSLVRGFFTLIVSVFGLCILAVVAIALIWGTGFILEKLSKEEGPRDG